MQAEFLKRTICALFEVHEDARDVYRIVTPLEYAGTGDRVVVRVRIRNGAFSIDENGEACLCASMIGGDVESGAVEQWSQGLSQYSPARLCDDEVIRATTTDERLVVPYVFRVAESAQQLYGVATSRAERRSGSDFKGRLSRTIGEIAEEFDLKHHSEVELPISGKFMADHVIETPTPSIVIAAMSDTRLLEGELIHMQYREAKKPGHVLAIAESQSTVGKAQFERANYYTWKTVVFDARNLRSLIASVLH
ncbi:hypothetical protein [Caballeronia catudaia]|uniref:hypothetical protein n=1 Tax=Caballeronia catudaia TaxID=1777136 RepID=UPI00077267EC|nr:hypothetical protein [Caballeronia catudaia]